MTSAMNAKIMVSKQHVLAFFFPSHIEDMPLFLAQPGDLKVPKRIEIHDPHPLLGIFTHPTPQCNVTALAPNHYSMMNAT